MTSITTLVVMSIFPTVYMHIRSPAIDTVADSIFYVSTNGGAYISDYISTYSYGRRSPCFEHDRDNAGCFIFLTGHVFGNWEVTVIDSYGNSPDISDVRFVWMIFPSGFINHNLDYTISYSYGRISPVTTISEFTQIVYPNGILNNGSYGVDNSYGTLRTSIMYIHGSLV